MSNTAPGVIPISAAAPIADPELAQLQDALKRCSPATFEAACLFRRTGNAEYLRPVILGVIERYVERELRAKLKSNDETLRLVEDLGIDSLTLMEIVVLTEDVLRINVTNEELVQLRTIGDVRQFLTGKLTVQPR